MQSANCTVAIDSCVEDFIVSGSFHVDSLTNLF